MEKQHWINNPIIGQATYMPRYVSKNAMLTYGAAMLLCAVLYSHYILPFQWWIFGIIEVCGFFYYSNLLSKKWINIGPLTFAKKLFWMGFSIRVVWVLISYILYTDWTGIPFSIGAADELFYNEAAQYGASMLREGNWNLYSGIAKYAGDITFSDLGYPIYLSFIYWIFDDSVLIARIFKAIWSAWTAVLIYKLASRNFGEQTGRLAGILCMLMPNLTYYCSFQLKEVEMVFLTVLFVERADNLLRKGKLTLLPTLLLLLIPTFMFMIRTPLAATLVLAFFCALLFSSTRVVSWGRRIVLILAAVIFSGLVLFSSSSIGSDVYQMWETGASEQQNNMEWRSRRSGALSQRFAKYAGASVFAPMIFTLPFPTMTDTPNQENQKLIHGGNFVKNIVSYFTIMSLVFLLFSGEWRKYVLPLAVLCGYLVVLTFSNFAQSERFHQPILPFILLFAAYGINLMNKIKWIKQYFPYWCVLMFLAALAWNWFKLAGRGMI